MDIIQESKRESLTSSNLSINVNMINDYICFIDRTERTANTYIVNLKQFAAWLRYSNIDRPQRQDIISYRDYLSAEHDAIKLDPYSMYGWSYRLNSSGNTYKIKCKPNTVAQYLRSVSQFFRWTAANGLYPNIADNIHAPKIRHDIHKKEALNAQEVLCIEQSISLKAADKVKEARQAKKDSIGKACRAELQGKRMYAMYLLAVNCGLRTVEISRANIQDLEVKHGTAYLYVWGKGHTEADTKKMLAPEVYKAIKEYLSERPDGKQGSSPLFVSTGNRSGGKRIAPTTISKMLKRSMQEAGFDSERITAHSLRHTAGTNVQELTGNLYLTQKYMRHSNPATTEIYLHNKTDKAEQDIAQRLYNFYHGKNDSSGKLQSLIQSLKPEQLEQLTNIAAAMAM